MNHRQRVESVGTVSKPGRVVNPGQVQREPAAWLGGTRHKGGVTLHRVRLFFVEELLPYSWAFLPAGAANSHPMS